MDITKGLNVDAEMKMNSRATPRTPGPNPHASNERTIRNADGYDPLSDRAPFNYDLEGG